VSVCDVATPRMSSTTTLSSLSDQGQGHAEGQGRVRGVTSAMTSSRSGSCEKPQKPAKPKNLWSRDADSRDHVTRSTWRRREPASSVTHDPDVSQPRRPNTADDVGQTSPRSNCEQQVPWTNASQVSLSLQQSDMAVGLNDLNSDDKQPTQWTKTSTDYTLPSCSATFSYQNVNINGESSCRGSCPSSRDEQRDGWTTETTETVSQSSDVICDRQKSDNGVEVSCGQVSPSYKDNELSQWTAMSIESVPHNASHSDPADVSAETTRGQSSPGCNDDELARWTEPSHHVAAVSAGDDIDPPVIYDLLPDNVHVTRGESLKLVAQFSAFPPPHISWYRANDLLTPGDQLLLYVCLSVCLSVARVYLSLYWKTFMTHF